jgi:cytochrome c oxidase cbb3-type subunit 4
MDVNDMRAAVTVFSFVLFIGVMAWTWSKRRAADFDEAAHLPFADDAQRADKGETR